MKRLYHFLGSIYVALLLIGLTTAWVIAGTFIESLTDSHAHAAYWTYEHPLFLLMLGGYFINILFSALRRWPWRPAHAPFLITHLGLLMLLTGVFVKVMYGTQGVMGIVEGSGSDEIFRVGTQVVDIQERDGTRTQHAIEELETEGMSAHCRERRELWIKGQQLVIKGLGPLPLSSEEDLKPAYSGPLLAGDETVWDVIALRSNSPKTLLQRLWLREAEVEWIHNPTGRSLGRFPLEQRSLQLEIGQVESGLELEWSAIHGIESACFKWTNQLHGEKSASRGSMELLGPAAGLLTNVSEPWAGAPLLRPVIRRRPLLLVLEDHAGDELVALMSGSGALHAEVFRPDQLSSYLSYANGFEGYGVTALLPATHMHPAFNDPESAHLHALIHQLGSADELSVPLTLLKAACVERDVDFLESTARFLRDWDRFGSWLYPPRAAAQWEPLPWEQLPGAYKRGAEWCVALMEELLPRLKEGDDFFAVLEELSWPLIEPLRELGEEASVSERLIALSQQIISLADQLPDPKQLPDRPTDAQLLSVLMQAHGIHLRRLMEEVDGEETLQRMAAAAHLTQLPQYEIECPLTLHHKDLPPISKWEELRPRVVLQSGLSLSYDRFATGLRWPSADGQQLLRFQPRTETLPYFVRLRDTRQINYAGTNQPFSYESELLVLDKRTGQEREATISMNEVLETADGYRFYMANITPPNESSVQRAQLVVNRDPAKYWLTYPGGILVAIGIVWLFGFRGRKR